MTDTDIKVTAKQMHEVLYQLFLKNNFKPEKADLLAKVHTDSTLYGVNSHGINRVARCIEYVKDGLIRTNAEAKKVGSFGSLERWDGQLGSGVINATKCANRAIKLAKQFGIGLVALRNTNHWMRGGTYGRQAADDDCIAIMFTNTQPNMPPWGGKDSRIGNNPLVVAIPREQGHVVMDMSISQFSFGKIHDYKLQGKKLPFVGGWDDSDTLSNNPEKILSRERGLPIGYWKGSALSMILDLLATLLSAGDSTYKIGQKKYETSISQVFLCIYPEVFGDTALQEKLVNEVIAYTRNVDLMNEGNEIFYPGEQSARNRERNIKAGMSVNKSIWETVLELTV